MQSTLLAERQNKTNKRRSMMPNNWTAFPDKSCFRLLNIIKSICKILFLTIQSSTLFYLIDFLQRIFKGVLSSKKPQKLRQLSNTFEVLTGTVIIFELTTHIITSFQNLFFYHSSYLIKINMFFKRTVIILILNLYLLILFPIQLP